MRILSHVIAPETLDELTDRERNQLVGCMHAHNEITLLNRLLLFAANDFADGPLHDAAQSVQVWSILQLLTGKLFETWDMLNKRLQASRSSCRGPRVRA